MLRKIAVALLWLLVFADMAFIFTMSAQNKEQSNDTSGKTIEITIEKIDPNFKKLPPEQKKPIIKKFQNFFRKCAHFLLYLLMGLFCALAFLLSQKCKRATYAVSQSICTLYAATDEIHQAFVPGRGPMVTDVILDSVGALSGILIALLLYYILLKIIKFSRTA